MRSISVIINARLQSTRVPKKLVRPFAGTTLIEIALEKLNQMDFFENRYFAAAEEALFHYVDLFPHVELLKRPPEAVIPGFNDPKIVHGHYLQIPSDYIFWMNPCHPLLSIETIKKSFDYFQSTDHPSYTSALRTQEWIYDMDGTPITNPDANMISTHHSPYYYKVAHGFHIFNKAHFEKTGILTPKKKNDPHFIEIPVEEVFDTDTPLEFRIAELMYLDAQGKIQTP